MNVVFENALVFSHGSFSRRRFPFVSHGEDMGGSVRIDSSDFVILPGFTDLHVHFREPGFSYKETITTGSAAAAAGGYTTVCTMPNLSPVPDSVGNLEPQLAVIRRDAAVRVLPYGAITKGEAGEQLSDMEALAPLVCGFSDDGRGVRDGGMMREAMIRAAALGKLIAAHCEDYTQIKDSPEAEWHEIERDLRLAADTGCAYHICHVSTRESVNLIRDAKKSGVNVTAETAPHYLLLTAADRDGTGRFIMNPPLRRETDRQALIEATNDGTLDAIATDHAPHSAEEKSRGNASLNGITGLETAFAVLYEKLVKTGILPPERLVTLLSDSPAARIGQKTDLADSFSVWTLGDPHPINPAAFCSMGKSTPFEGWQVSARNLITVCGGRIVWGGLGNFRD